MSSILTERCFLGLAFAVGGGAASLPEPSAAVQVWTYNYAGVSPATIARAQSEASRIFAHASVRIEWVDCPPTAMERELFPRCRLGEHQNLVVLRVFSGMPPEELVSSRHVFGMARLDDDGNGYLADVYTAATRLIEGASFSDRAAVLGHLMAHELGHLLLASPTHSSKGIMRPRWSEADLRLAMSGGLLFNAKQAKRMASNVRARAPRHAYRGEPTLPAHRTVKSRM